MNATAKAHSLGKRHIRRITGNYTDLSGTRNYNRSIILHRPDRARWRLARITIDRLDISAILERWRKMKPWPPWLH
jgi:hypothetical protein